MQYFGGKAKIAKYIVSYLEEVRKENQIYVEPFVGGANIVSKMGGVRKAYDFNEYLIEMYKAVQNGYELPNIITEKDYKYIRENKDKNKALTGFVGFGCSFAGKWFGGSFTKCVLQAKNKNQLLKAKTMAEESGMKEGEDFFLIRDNCYTEITPEEDGKTLTCIGFRPMDEEDIDKIGRKYHLYMS